MQVKLSQVRAFFVAVGVDTAAGWEVKKASDRLPDVTKYRDALKDVKDEDVLRFYDAVSKAVTDKEAVEVVDDVTDPDPTVKPAKKPAAKKGGKKAGAKPKAKPAAAKAPSVNGTAGGDYVYKPGVPGSWAAAKAYWAKHPRALPTKGLIAEVVAELKAAGRGANPTGLTKAAIVGVLAANHKDRDPLKMEVYVGNLVPSRLLSNFGVHCHKVRTGKAKETAYYIKGDGSEAPPPVVKAAKPAPKAVTGKKPAAKKAKKAAAKKGGKKGKKAATTGSAAG